MRKPIRSSLLVTLCGAMLLFAACDSTPQDGSNAATSEAGSEAADATGWQEFVDRAESDLTAIEQAFARIPKEFKAVDEYEVEHVRARVQDLRESLTNEAAEAPENREEQRARLKRSFDEIVESARSLLDRIGVRPDDSGD